MHLPRPRTEALIATLVRRQYRDIFPVGSEKTITAVWLPNSWRSCIKMTVHRTCPRIQLDARMFLQKVPIDYRTAAGGDCLSGSYEILSSLTLIVWLHFNVTYLLCLPSCPLCLFWWWSCILIGDILAISSLSPEKMGCGILCEFFAGVGSVWVVGAKRTNWLFC